MNTLEKENDLDKVVDEIRERFGFTKLIYMSSKLEGARAVERSKLVGGHAGGMVGLENKESKKKTEKKFENYSDYHDRPFGLKWGTAFPIDELNKVIVENKDKEQNSVEELPQMSREEIDKVLQYAFLKSKTISIQLNERNEMGHYKENIIGHFKGFADAKYLYVEDEAIEWINIRNIAVI